MLHTYRALLDSCSQANFVSESLVQRLAFKKFHNCAPLQGMNTVRVEVKYGSTVQILNMTTNYSATLDCAVLPRISDNLSGNSISYQDRIQLNHQHFISGMTTVSSINFNIFASWKSIITLHNQRKKMNLKIILFIPLQGMLQEYL
ncbi:hypothetical protein PR048_020195 [Dryococelus australis]|uniref:Uncharacterized protein n=1 Tax=Dryococelus australis TaxID=614101 RepID=A0ABQ9H5L5_9NEOP|nr:hypothetical protein PR048_020195 [Dryococelus australis]